jgi:ribosomal protein S18 acetylase RimI-like enzyme
MIASPLVSAASANLRYTYFELGRASQNSYIWSETGFDACIGEFEHPICNFAAGLSLDRASACRLAQVAIERASFNVYATPVDRPGNVGDLLMREGFQRNYRMVQMVAEPDPSEPKGTLIRASTRLDRKQIALFMVDQFFTKHKQPFREKVAEATAAALNLELLAMRRDRRLLAAAMVCFSEGIAGVYNVCVDSSLRGLGIGTSMMKEILAVCSVKGAAATLQCDPKLEGWYLDQGFRRTGEVDVYALPKSNGFAIMQ